MSKIFSHVGDQNGSLAEDQVLDFSIFDKLCVSNNSGAVKAMTSYTALEFD